MKPSAGLPLGRGTIHPSGPSRPRLRSILRGGIAGLSGPAVVPPANRLHGYFPSNRSAEQMSESPSPSPSPAAGASSAAAMGSLPPSCLSLQPVAGPVEPVGGALLAPSKELWETRCLRFPQLRQDP